MDIQRLKTEDMMASDGFDHHEAVYSISDSELGLEGFIAIHDTTLGPAAGGCRFWTYGNRGEALSDALRLSKAMSFKNAMAGLPLGGGKAVVWAEHADIDRAAFFHAFGRAVETLNGQYITAEDVGTRIEDMVAVSAETSFVSGLPAQEGQPGGDPSPSTAHGVFLGIGAAVKFALSRSHLEGVRVAVQGLGNVGFQLCEELHNAGAELVVADIDEAKVRAAAEKFQARVVSAADILFEPVDVVAPCALGGVLTKENVGRLNTKIVAGAANNQLSSDQVGELMRLRGILYAPDYVINAGGIIQVAAEYLGLSSDLVEERISMIPMSLQQIFEESNWRHQSTNQVADTLARTRLAASQPAAAAG